MNVILDPDRCTGCRICVSVCPQKVLEMRDNKMHVADPDRCMGCMGCEDECPTNAVRVQRGPVGSKILVEADPVDDRSCDMLVVGAGPSGLGAAIAGARKGLDVMVVERLANRHVASHPDGGALIGIPGIVSVAQQGSRIRFPELDIAIEAPEARRCESLRIVGPGGRSTKGDFPMSAAAWTIHKDHLVAGLCDQAEASGAKVRYGSKVTDVLRSDAGLSGVVLDDGTKVSAKVVVMADGVHAKMTQKAGLKVDRHKPTYANVLAYEYDDPQDLPVGLDYVVGDMPFGPGGPPAFGGYAVTNKVHVLFVMLSHKRTYGASEPMDYYLKRFIEQDPRIPARLKAVIHDQRPSMLSGCRVPIRGNPNLEPAGDGVVSVGDTWVHSGELGNATALANGVFAGEVIARAAKKNDFARNALAEVGSFVTHGLFRALQENRKYKLLPVLLNEAEIRQLMLFMEHMNYPILMAGTPMQKAGALAQFMAANALRFFKYRKVAKFLM